MTKFRSRIAIAAFAVAGAAALGSGVAAAAPAPHSHPLLDTTCSFEQVEKALRAVDPAKADRLEKNPQHKQRLQQFLALPPAQRHAKADQWRTQHPDKVQHHQQWAQQHQDKVNQAKATMATVAQTCSKY